MEGTGLKQYQRWKNFTSPRADENGELTRYFTSVNNYFSTTSKSTTSNYLWNYTGPIGLFDAPLSGTGKGWVNRILVDETNPSIIYAGTHNSGLWRTTDGGLNWYLLTVHNPEINGIASMFRSKDVYGTIYLATATNITNYSNGIFKSEDNGANWVPVDVNIYPSTNFKNIPRKIVEHPNDTNILFLLTECYLYKSIDKGQNWSEVLSDDTGDLDYWGNEKFSDIVFDNRDPNIMYLGGFKVLKSTDGGITWQTDLTQDITGADKIDFCIMETIAGVDENHPNYGDTWFLSVDNNGMLRITKFDYSNNQTFDELYSIDNKYIKANGRKCTFIVDPNNENRIIYSGLQITTINYKSLTGEWIREQVSQRVISPTEDDNILHDDIRDLIFYQSGGKDHLAVACDGGVSLGTFQSISNYKEDWKFMDISVSENTPETDLNINEVYAISTNNSNDNIIFNCQDVGGYRINSNILERIAGGDGGSILYDNIDPNYYYNYDYQYGIFSASYRDAGYFGDKLYPEKKYDGYYFAPIVKDPNNSKILYAGGERLFKYIDSYNSGEEGTITLVNIEDFFCNIDGKQSYFKYNNYLTDIEISKNNANLMFVSTNRSYFFWSRDKECNSPPDPQYYRKAFLKSLDGGSSWIDLSPNIEGLQSGNITDIRINPNDDNEIYLCFGSASANNSNTTKKIYKSTDGGQTFTPFAQGIPDKIPVWEMEYDSYTDILYIATDIGIFSRPADGSSDWVDITEDNGNFPVIMVTDIEINYKNRKLYAGTFGRGIWETSLEDCPEYDGINDVVITGSVEWNEPHSINSNLIINPGATLTIKDAVYFNSGSRFIIREGENGTEGGHLILDGAVLTNGCDDNYWKGIEVWGNGYEDQNPLYQGWITMKNNSVISNAEIGILANNSDYQNAAFNYHGCIVHLSNSTFINNIVSVQLEDYHHQTFNQINNCKFITDENWAHYGASPDRFISYSNYGFETNENGRSYKQEVKGCSFENFRYADEITQSDKWGKGIYAFNTRLLVDNLEIQDGTETWFKNSTFKHLYVGIEAMGSENMLPVVVSNSEFNKNKEGINLYNLYNSEITLNDFDVLETYNAHGLYLYYCPSGYQIESNNFWSENNATTNYGLIIHNSGENINLVYNNTFSNLNYASAFQEVNRIISGSREGLVVKCNTYSNNIYDIYVDGTKGIAFDQGSYNPQTSADLAGNIFSDASSIPNHYDILNQSSSINYNHHNQENTVLKLEPVQFTALTVFPHEFSQFEYLETESCPPTIDIGGGGTDIKTEMLLVNQSADSTLSIINDLEDGGDTYELYFNTETAMQGEEIETRDILISESPNLSDSVMISAIENEAALPNAIVRDVLIENPQAAKSDVVQSALDNKANTMPDYMRNEINQGLDTMSVLETKYSQLAALRLKEELYFNKLQKLYIQDSSISFLTDSLSVLYDLKGGLNNKYKKAMLYLSLNDTLSADTIIENIQLNFNLSSSQEAERQSYEYYFDVKKRMLSEGLSIPDSISIVELHEIHNTGTGNPVILSATLLEHINEISTVLPHYKADTATLKKGALTNLSFDENNVKQKTKYLLLKPNPAGNYFIAEYKLTENMIESSISITSIDGICKKTVSLHNKVDELVIETAGLNSGVYIVNLQSNGSIIDSKKLTIVK